MIERTDEAFELDMKLTVVGEKLRTGGNAPDFELDCLNPASGAIETIRLGDSSGKVRLLNVVNSLDTPVCQVETCRWEKSRAELPPDVVMYTVSMDLPYAQARWNTAENISHQALSSHRSEKFGQDYGVMIKEWRLLQRAVFVIDGNNKLVHVEYVPDQMLEPDYNAAMEAARRAVNNGK
jgi:thiol peroxidase